jgi:acyl-coenzyme A thioesterase PaaI-like protein
VEFQTRLLEPVSGEKLIARGQVVRTGTSLAIAEADVRTAEGRLMAGETGTFAVTSVPIE